MYVFIFASLQACNLRFPYSQNIRTCLTTGEYASTIIRASACLLLSSHPYSASKGTAKAEEGGSGLETPAGIHHGKRRSGTAGVVSQISCEAIYGMISLYDQR